MSLEILVVVPLRLESQRIPRKLLADLKGVPLAVAAVKQVKRSLEGFPNAHFLAAVDSEETARALSAVLTADEIILTDPALASGTDRVNAAAALYLKSRPEAETTLKAVVNVQGDMPYVSPSALAQLYRFCLEQKPKMATLVETWPHETSLTSMGAVKTLLNRDGRAIYFSRYPIPYSRIPPEEASIFSARTLCHYHVGVYSFDLPTLRQFCETPACDYEKTEGLEQLRALWMGVPIDALVVASGPGESPRGIDLPEDLEWARSFSG